jgi:hypothetical protein
MSFTSLILKNKEVCEMTTKIVFNGLGPSSDFRHEGIVYRDGMIAELPVDVALVAMSGGYAVEYTDLSLSTVTKKLESESKKRKEISEKVESLTKGGK